MIKNVLKTCCESCAVIKSNKLSKSRDKLSVTLTIFHQSNTTGLPFYKGKAEAKED